METKRLATKLMADNEASPLFRYRQASSSEHRAAGDSAVEKVSAASADVQDKQDTVDTQIINSSVPSSLPLKLAGDAAVGVGVTFLMAPFLSVVDRAISERAAGSKTIMSSCLYSLRSMVANPVAFARNPVFLWCWAVYGSTYTTANSLKTIVEHRKEFSNATTCSSSSKGPAAVDEESMGKLGIFLGTSLANSGASVMKDRAFAYMFATDAAAAAVQKVPNASYGLWLSRDLIGVGSSFVLPDLIAKRMSSENPEDMQKYRDMSQFGVPVATQFVAGPLHLLGLDLFNRPMQSISWRDAFVERTRFLMNGYSAVVGARIARIIPGYGFGGVMNTKLRDGWREHLLEREANGESVFPSVAPTYHKEDEQQQERASRLFGVIRHMQRNTLEVAF